ncbi:hypothetical protein LTR66_001992 [Elasticomyces elasticus]|nr:hypothetical protein LTR66_001992 [Elasticomyces elasticus]
MEPLADDAPYEQSSRGDHRSSFGYHGRTGSNRDHAWGPWTQEKADKAAVGIIRRARDEGHGEAMRDFIDLVNMRHGGGVSSERPTEAI